MCVVPLTSVGIQRSSVTLKSVVSVTTVVISKSVATLTSVETEFIKFIKLLKYAFKTLGDM